MNGTLTRCTVYQASYVIKNSIQVSCGDGLLQLLLMEILDGEILRALLGLCSFQFTK